MLHIMSLSVIVGVNKGMLHVTSLSVVVEVKNGMLHVTNLSDVVGGKVGHAPYNMVTCNGCGQRRASTT